MTNKAETEYEELIAELRGPLFGGFPKQSRFTRRAADAISTLLSQNARLREALKPFADMPGEGDEDFPDGPTLGDLRRARAALNGDPEQ